MLRKINIAFDRDDTSRYLPWLIACMVFLATLSVAGIFVLANLADRVQTGFNNTVTVQIPTGASKATDENDKVVAMSILRSMPNIVKAELVKPEGVVKLLKPWLGELANSTQLPIPTVIDVTIDRSADISSNKIRDMLVAKIPQVMVDDHREWLEELLHSIKSIKLMALLIVTLIIFATTVTVVFTARTSLGLQQETISILHFIGAYDRYIAYQFAIRAAWLGLKGSLGGLAIAVPLLVGFKLIVGNLATGLLPEINLDTVAWLTIGMIVPAVTGISVLTAYSTVIRSLSKLP